GHGERQEAKRWSEGGWLKENEKIQSLVNEDDGEWQSGVRHSATRIAQTWPRATSLPHQDPFKQADPLDYAFPRISVYSAPNLSLDFSPGVPETRRKEVQRRASAGDGAVEVRWRSYG
ncbi:MAG: hypothetical protein JO139_08595, partial [Alphaproteobacteria bacterium]|nr:hypothetical protein [Alphaproteobacteria bacterium]